MTPEDLRLIPLILFPIFFLLGVINRPVFLPISYMTLWLTKLANYYPFITDFKIELLIALACLCLSFLKSGDNVNECLSCKQNMIHRYLIMLLICMFISFIFSWNKQFSWDIKLYDFSKVIILYFMILLTVKTEGDLSIFIWFFVLLYAYIAYEPVYGFLNGIGGSKEMYGETYVSDSGLLSGHVALANNMNQMLPFAYFLFVGTKSKILKVMAAAVFVVFLICLVGSKSRGGVAGFLVLGAFIVFFSKNKLRNCLFVAFIGIMLFLSSGDMGATLSRIDSTSVNGRFIGLTHGLEMILKGNVIGVGPGCYLIARKYYFSYYMESHNIYGQVMGDLGIPGLIVAFLFVRNIFSYLLKSRKNMKMVGKEKSFLYIISTAMIVSFATRLFVSMGSHGLYFYYYYVIAALACVVARLAEKEVQIISPITETEDFRRSHAG